MATVSIIKATYSDIALETLLAPFGGMGQFVKQNEKVLLKVNLLSAKEPEKAVTTHPELVKLWLRLPKRPAQNRILETLPQDHFPKEVLKRPINARDLSIWQKKRFR